MGAYDVQSQTQLTFYNRSVEGAKQDGYPTFNECNHYIVDMSHLDPRSKDWLNTISIKLPNDIFVTLCVMQTSKDETCIDTKFHGENIEKHRVFALGGEGEDVNIYNKNIYALIAQVKDDIL
jgi:hypothetical protein